MMKPKPLPPGVEQRDLGPLTFERTVFETSLPQIDAAGHFLAHAENVLKFGPYGCAPRAMPSQFAATLAEKGMRARCAIRDALREVQELRAFEANHAETVLSAGDREPPEEPSSSEDLSMRDRRRLASLRATAEEAADSLTRLGDMLREVSRGE